MTTLTSKLQHLTALHLLSPESVASLAAAWDVPAASICQANKKIMIQKTRPIP